MAIPSYRNFESITEVHLEHFFNISPDFLCVAGYDGYLKKVNPSFVNTMGYSEQELMSRPINEFIYDGDKDITSKLRDNLRKNIPLLNFENRYVTQGGEIIWLHWTSIADPENQVIYAIAKDITHIKNLEEERNSLLANLTRINAELKQLTYATSHDLRAPVNNLLSLFSLIEIEKIQDKETRQYIEMVETSAINLKKTINKYIDVLGEKDKLEIKLESINLKETLRNTQQSIKTLIKNSNTVFQIDFSEFGELNFNSVYLHSIFLNLISNSIKYRQPGIAPIISITSRNSENFKQLIFEDNGKGFEMSTVKNKIFGLHQKFHEHDDSKGIGLYLVYNHMVSLGGSISVDSKINRGTRFILSFRN